MGNCSTIQQKFSYSQELSHVPHIPGETKPRRHPLYINQLVQKPHQNVHNVRDAFKHAIKTYSNSNCYGYISTNQKGQKKIVSHTFQQVNDMSENFVKALDTLKIKIIEQVPGLKVKLIGIFSKNRLQWMITDIASAFGGYTTVPLYDTLGKENIIYILNQTNMQICCCNKQCLQTLLKLQNLGKLKTIISYDPIPSDTLNKANLKGIKILLYSQLISQGKKNKSAFVGPIIHQESIHTFCYTSGTTGPPKGAMLSHKNFVSTIPGVILIPYITPRNQDVYLSYLPLPHMMERIILHIIFYVGAFAIFSSGDVLKLKEDIQLVKPTYFASVPRLYNKFYQAITEKFSKLQGLSKILANKAVQSKLQAMKQNGEYQSTIYDKLVFEKTKAAFGGRVRIMLSGSAPLLPNVHAFMQIIACAPLLQGYGQTQSMGPSFAVMEKDPQTGHVGGPLPIIDFKLQDIPQMNYRSTDKDQNGILKPRGQICMRGAPIFKGYYKNKQKTDQAIDKDGWLHTGDVGQIQPNGSLKIIDRKKNIFKLQQGEYVAPQKVQAICRKMNNISEMFLHGASTQNFAVAIIVPLKQKLQKLAQQNNIKGSYEEICSKKQLRVIFLKALNKFTKQQGLNSFEQPKNIYFETKSFADQKLLTSTMKFQRFEARNFYQKQIKAMYAEGMI